MLSLTPGSPDERTLRMKLERAEAHHTGLEPNVNMAWSSPWRGQRLLHGVALYRRYVKTPRAWSSLCAVKRCGSAAWKKAFCVSLSVFAGSARSRGGLFGEILGMFGPGQRSGLRARAY